MIEEEPAAVSNTNGGDGHSEDVATALALARKEASDAKAELNALRRAISTSGATGAAASELQHHVRNLLAVVRAIFSRTVDTSPSPEDLIDHFRGRLDALARHQIASTRKPGGQIDVEGIVRDELLVTRAGDSPRITLTGPAIGLQGKAAEMFGLAVHELATNSVKFGVIGDNRDAGSLDIRWDMTDDDFRFRWTEKGVPVLSAAPLRYGFGREFIEEALPYQIGAQTSFQLQPGGLECSIEIPTSRIDDALRGGTILARAR